MVLITQMNRTLCFGNMTDEETALLQSSMGTQLNHIYKLWQGLVPFPMALIGLFLSSLYIFAVCKAIRQHRVSRKCYVLLLNRAFGDVFACLMALVISVYTMSVEIVSRDTMQLLDTFFMCSFWSAMVSYVALSLIKLYAVWQPLNYRKKVTMRRCIYLTALSWVIFVLFVASALMVFALVRIEFLNRWSGCRSETCVRYMYRVRNTLVTIIYFFTIICFLVTVVLIRRARRFTRSFHQKSSTATRDTVVRRRSLKERFPLWKLALNVATFAFFNAFYAIWGLALLTRTDRCFFLKHFNLMMLLLGFVRISLLARIIMDPILSFITDIQIRRSVLTLLCFNGKVKPTDSKKRMWGRSHQQSEDNSSDADLKHMSTRQSTVRTNRKVSTYSLNTKREIPRF